MFIWIKADNQSGSQLSYFSGGAVAPFTYQTAVSCSEKKVLQNLEKTPGNFVCFLTENGLMESSWHAVKMGTYFSDYGLNHCYRCNSFSRIHPEKQIDSG